MMAGYEIEEHEEEGRESERNGYTGEPGFVEGSAKAVNLGFRPASGLYPCTEVVADPDGCDEAGQSEDGVEDEPEGERGVDVGSKEDFKEPAKRGDDADSEGKRCLLHEREEWADTLHGKRLATSSSKTRLFAHHDAFS